MEQVTNIKNWLDDNYTKYTFEYIVSAIDKDNEYINDFFKSYDDLELAIRYAKELYEFLKEKADRIEIDYEITGWQENYNMPETVMCTTILEYKCNEL